MKNLLCLLAMLVVYGMVWGFGSLTAKEPTHIVHCDIDVPTQKTVCGAHVPIK